MTRTLHTVGRSAQRRFPWALFMLLSFAAASSPCFAADEEDDDEPKYAAGLIAEYRQTARTVERSARRVDLDLQFVWGEDRPDERLAPGEFAATWQGKLFTMTPGSYRFHVFVGGGELELKLGGKTLLHASAAKPAWHVSEPITLGYAHTPLEISFRKTAGNATLKLHWSGPQFAVEPVPERHLFHDPKQTPASAFDEGQALVRVLRCASCHRIAAGRVPLPAPALTHLSGNIEPAWLIAHLAASGRTEAESASLARRMPYSGLSESEALAIAAYLLSGSEKSPEVNVAQPIERKIKPPITTDPRRQDEPKKSKPKPRTEPTVRDGELLARSVGCLACHKIGPDTSGAGSLGTSGLFSGGDLTTIARKRPPEFFLRWLAEPAKINADHRMPVFKLSELERADLGAYLATLRERASDVRPAAIDDSPVAQGRALVAAQRCAACHRLPKDAARLVPDALPLHKAWEKSCFGEPDVARHRPGYRLDERRRAAIVEYLSTFVPSADEKPAYDGRFVLAERNCTACHARGLGFGIAEQAPKITAVDAELLPVQAALLPPSLSGVGDKLTAEAMTSAIELKRDPLRPWLRVRMPKFTLTAEERAALAAHFVDHDRIPELPAPAESTIANLDDSLAAQRLAAHRLVTSDGFGCTSCHKIGKSDPVGIVNIAAHGTDLTLLGSRLRKPWFDRWVRNPARIIPRMEMPAIQLPVKGVLHDDVDEQLAAVWNVLNEPGFTPPLPNPVRIVRSRNVPGLREPANVLTDVFVVDGTTYDSAIVIGLPNRHNILFDLEHNRLAAWWTGDTALERTKGKSWYWEPGGMPVVDLQGTPKYDEPDLRFTIGKPAAAAASSQNSCELDSITHTAGGISFDYRSMSGDRQQGALRVRQTFEPLPSDPKSAKTSGFRRTIEIVGSSAVSSLADLPLILEETQNRVGSPRIVDRTRAAGSKRNAYLTSVEAQRGEEKIARIVVDYLVDLPLDSFPNEVPPATAPPVVKLEVVPGYEAVQLPLTVAEMPTGLAWKKDGTLVFTSLKGRVVEARDTNGDGLEDTLRPVSDDLAAPYGIAVAEQDGKEVLDVVNKFGLVRLHDDDDDGDGYRERIEVVASGWGHTDDYHDWAVGLPKIPGGGYYVALPCQQDERDPKKAALRGQGLRLLPRTPTKDDPRRFKIEPFCGGLRFPMGLAVNRAGDLFASDNQGNYNPFNEINHLTPGARYGFINKLESQPGFAPPVETPAVELPHPWTRSVNGICFLDTPPAVREKLRREGRAENLFGEFEGHLIGCEYNYRALYRMALEKIDGTYQGAAFPFSASPQETGPKEKQPTFEGPTVCEVAPSGDLYVGNLQDSGWGGGRNTGSIVRLRPHGKLPAGLASISAQADGFTLRFTQPVERAAASEASAYTVESFRRISTPQYGGNDVEREAVRVKSAITSDDGRQVRLTLDKMKQGFVYEFHLRSLAPAGEPFFPAEAFYTLKRIPRGP
ncbi:MAG: c-type cytochrome [Planctomycetia bacterium]|nr:c-type cytochrome [Planctomycetia bacterium]